MANEITDDHGNCWEKCDRDDCDLHLVRPGKAQCSSYCADIVERLLELHNDLIDHDPNGDRDPFFGDDCKVVWEAIEEIQRLRSETKKTLRQKIRNLASERDDWRARYFHAIEEIRRG